MYIYLPYINIDSSPLYSLICSCKWFWPLFNMYMASKHFLMIFISPLYNTFSFFWHQHTWLHLWKDLTLCWWAECSVMEQKRQTNMQSQLFGTRIEICCFILWQAPMSPGVLHPVHWVLGMYWEGVMFCGWSVWEGAVWLHVAGAILVSACVLGFLLCAVLLF